MPRGDLIQVRKGTAAQWTAVNPILAEGELGLETDTGKIKGGNGSTAWNSLPYSGSGGGGGSVDSVNGRTGVVTLSKSDVGLSNVDNTSDLSKPISTATQTALNLKADTSALTSGLSGKQDALVSGTNIRTVNGTSLLGSGDVSISGATTVKTTSIEVPRTQGGRFEHTQVITDAGVSPSSKISISLGSTTDADENTADFIDLEAISATAGSGSFTVISSFKTKTAGNINLNYIIGV